MDIITTALAKKLGGISVSKQDVTEAVEGYLAKHPEAMATTDDTLSVRGIAADAKAVGDAIDDVFSNTAKQALLECFSHVAWADEYGQDYYDALADALYPGTYPKITATFTKGNHTVYIDSALSTIIPYLTVVYYETAASAGRTLTNSEYSLSGYLSSKINRIQVSYQGLSVNIVVTAEASGVPSGYTLYDYIRAEPVNEINRSAYYEYTNGVFQIKDLNANLVTKTFPDLYALNYHFKALDDRDVLASNAGFLPIIGGRISNDERSMALYRKHDFEAFSVHCHGANLPFDHTFDNSLHDYKIINPASSPSEIRIDDNAFTVNWLNSNVVNYFLGLFTNRTSTNTESYINNAFMLGVFEITDRNANMVAKYIPVKRDSDNVVGIYDVVGQEFKTSVDPKYATQGNTYCIYGVGNWS